MRDSRDVEVRVEGCRVLGVVVGDFSGRNYIDCGLFNVVVLPVSDSEF